jgi:hypothetical protein
MLASLLMTTAVAGVPADSPVLPPFRTVAAGAVLGGVGAVTAGVGLGWTVRNLNIPLVRFDETAPTLFYTGPQAVMYTGLGLVVAGAPVMAVGALRARAVADARRVPWWPGAAAIGAAALAVPAVVGPGGIVTSGLLTAGAYTLATTQWSMVRRRELRRASAQLVPVPPGAGGPGGVALAGWW